uniref:Emp24/gp25L/p24 family protein n=1 Tax=Rhizophora mucronata TaxID=61149 RepID=A0A2P2N611_RHIMU
MHLVPELGIDNHTASAVGTRLVITTEQQTNMIDGNTANPAREIPFLAMIATPLRKFSLKQKYILYPEQPSSFGVCHPTFFIFFFVFSFSFSRLEF